MLSPFTHMHQDMIARFITWNLWGSAYRVFTLSASVVYLDRVQPVTVPHLYPSVTNKWRYGWSQVCSSNTDYCMLYEGTCLGVFVYVWDLTYNLSSICYVNHIVCIHHNTVSAVSNREGDPAGGMPAPFLPGWNVSLTPWLKCIADTHLQFVRARHWQFNLMVT